MKKFLIAVVVVLVIAIVGLPPVLGMRTESTISERMTGATPGGVFESTIESFDRGWFSSTATVRMVVSDTYVSQLDAIYGVGQGPLETIRGAELLVGLDIDHGPVSFGNGFFVGLSKFVARPTSLSDSLQELVTVTGMPYLFELRGRIGLTGVFAFDADVPEFDFADPTLQAASSGVSVEGQLAGADLDLTATIDSVFLEYMGVAGDLTNLTFAADLEYLTPDLYIGTIEGGIDSIVVGDPTGGSALLSLHELTLVSRSGIDDDGLYDGGGEIGAATVVAGNGAFDLANARIGFRIEDVAPEVLERYSTLWQDLAFDDPSALSEQLQVLLQDLLATSPTLAYDPIEFEYFGDSFSADIVVRGSAASAAALDSFTLENPAWIAQVVDVSAHIDVAKALARRLANQAVTAQIESQLGGQGLPPGQDVAAMAEEQVDVMLTTVVGQGFVVDTGERYTTAVEFANGVLTINGNPMPFGLP
jgi:uncharacterized protein YdgA (DUF945 family)